MTFYGFCRFKESWLFLQAPEEPVPETLNLNPKLDHWIPLLMRTLCLSLAFIQTHSAEEVCRTGPLGRKVPRAEIGGVEPPKPVCPLENLFGGLALSVMILFWLGVVRDTRVGVRELSASACPSKVQL